MCVIFFFFFCLYSRINVDGNLRSVLGGAGTCKRFTLSCLSNNTCSGACVPLTLM